MPSGHSATVSAMTMMALLYYGVGSFEFAISAMLAVEIKNFFVGYSYDYAISDISKVSNGSHEIFAGYKLKLNLGDKNKNKHKSIRIM